MSDTAINSNDEFKEIRMSSDTSKLADKNEQLFRLNTGDVTVNLKDDMKLYVHKCFLILSSDVFKQMFLTPMVETETNTIIMDKHSAVAVKLLFYYMYCEKKIMYDDEKLDTIFELLDLTSMYQMGDYYEYLSKMPVTFDNCEKILFYCNLYPTITETIYKKTIELFVDLVKKRISDNVCYDDIKPGEFQFGVSRSKKHTMKSCCKHMDVKREFKLLVPQKHAKRDDVPQCIGYTVVDEAIPENCQTSYCCLHRQKGSQGLYEKFKELPDNVKEDVMKRLLVI